MAERLRVAHASGWAALHEHGRLAHLETELAVEGERTEMGPRLNKAHLQDCAGGRFLRVRHSAAAVQRGAFSRRIDRQWSDGGDRCGGSRPVIAATQFGASFGSVHSGNTGYNAFRMWFSSARVRSTPLGRIFLPPTPGKAVAATE
jgi:hypothetical protein